MKMFTPLAVHAKGQGRRNAQQGRLRRACPFLALSGRADY
jgi:hypothetical protein